MFSREKKKEVGFIVCCFVFSQRTEASVQLRDYIDRDVTQLQTDRVLTKLENSSEHMGWQL